MALTAQQRLAQARARSRNEPVPDFSNTQPADRSTNQGQRREFSADIRHEEYTIRQTGVIEACFQNTKCVSALIHVTGGTVNGVFSAPPGICYVGRNRKHLNDLRDVADQYFPIEIPETPLSEVQNIGLYVNGTAGTVIVAILR